MAFFLLWSIRWNTSVGQSIGRYCSFGYLRNTFVFQWCHWLLSPFFSLVYLGRGCLHLFQRPVFRVQQEGPTWKRRQKFYFHHKTAFAPQLINFQSFSGAFIWALLRVFAQFRSFFRAFNICTWASGIFVLSQWKALAGGDQFLCTEKKNTQ